MTPFRFLDGFNILQQPAFYLYSADYSYTLQMEATIPTKISPLSKWYPVQENRNLVSALFDHLA